MGAQCPNCGGPSTELGQLGRVSHYRCRDCGTDHSERPEFNDRRPKAKAEKGWYGLWHGGGSYASPSTDDAERFTSISHAKDVFSQRYGGYDPISGLQTPAVDETSEMHLYKGHPAESGQPDKVIRRGRRGATRALRA